MKKLLSSDRIKAEALRLGFSACGLAPAEAVDETVATAFRQWLADGCQAEMAYMQNYEDKRLDPRLLVEGARTVISVALNYYPATKIPEGEYQIAWYAYGKDYHDVMKVKLKELFEFIQKEVSSSEAEITTGSRSYILRYSSYTGTLLGMALRLRLDRKEYPAHHPPLRFLLLFGRNYH